MVAAETMPTETTIQPARAENHLTPKASLRYTASPALFGKREESSAYEKALNAAIRAATQKAIGVYDPARPATFPISTYIPAPRMVPSP